jgi:hypothetical protein
MRPSSSAIKACFISAEISGRSSLFQAEKEAAGTRSAPRIVDSQ